MRSFTDGKGDVWDVDINLATLQLVRSRLDLCLVPLDVEDAKSNRAGADLERLRKEHATFAKMVFTLVEEQAQARGIAPAEFASGERMDLATFLAAREAVDSEITFFSLRGPMRDRARAAIQAGNAKRAAAMQRVEAIQEKLVAEMESDAASNSSATNSPPSPESPTPAP